jgi:TolB protein
MLVNFDESGKKSAFCASRGNGGCQIYIKENDIIKPCTKNTGNNDSPIFLDNERICFCSNFQTGSPQIYIGNLTTGHLQRITHGGYCTCPSYCAKTNKIAYHKMIQGTMQIMEYDCATKMHTQLTHSNGNKHEASWSPDGTMLSFSHEGPNHTSRIESLNLLTKKTKFLTKAGDYCSYPNCGPCYQTFPVMT